ncbi:MAG TPA: molybdenum cofactor guanylyltransferase [Steroidobacteraceae bacterium]|nr:molybdenum cofactor guanylyltransferase [Steroidobacteraceae bacterium]
MSADTPPASHTVVGVVLAGGRSVRFGGEKAAALLRGTPLLLWAARRLARSCAAVAVNTRPGTEAESLAQAAGLPVLHDMPGDAAGPMAGVKAGLAWARGLGATSLAVSPCDAPLLPEDLFARLSAAAGSGAAMAETADGVQPLCAIWPVSALAELVRALAGGAHPPTWRTLEGIGARRVHFADAAAFANLNTRADLAALEERLGRNA